MEYKKSMFWLKTASVVTIGFGILIAASALPLLAAPTLFLIDFMFFPLDGHPSESSHALRLASAICGGVMAGWGVLLYQLTTHLLEREPALVRQFILTSLFTWFGIDSMASMAAGAWMNVVGNVIFLLLFVLPIRRISPKIKRTSPKIKA